MLANLGLVPRDLRLGIFGTATFEPPFIAWPLTPSFPPPSPPTVTLPRPRTSPHL